MQVPDLEVTLDVAPLRIAFGGLCVDGGYWEKFKKLNPDSTLADFEWHVRS